MVLVALLLPGMPACKAELGTGNRPDGGSGTPDGSALVVTDAGPDAQIILGPWGAPQKITGASATGVGEDDVTLSSNKLELVFKRDDAGDPNLYMMTRATTSAAFGAPVALGVLNTSATEESPRMSADDTTLYFGRGGDIYMSTRAALGQPWGAATAVATLNTGGGYEKWAHVCPSGYAIVSRDTGNGNGQDLYAGTISVGAPTVLTALNSGNADQGTLLSNDCLHLYFQSNRDGAQFDLFEAARTNAADAWPAPTKLVDFNTTTSNEEDPWESTDGTVFVYASNAGGDKDLYISTR
jgi:Tol biopolymer transport system component